jgi:hypothetical protein
MKLISELWLKRKCAEGQSLVEISLLTPILLIALYIPADFGIAFFVGNMTATATREGARIGSGLKKTGGTSTVPNFSSTEAVTVKTSVFDRLPVYLTNRQVRVKFYEGVSCLEFIEVTATGNYNFFLYQVLRLLGASVPNSIQISRTTQLRYNYQPFDNNNLCTTTTVDQSYTS